jgi:hypothetical protein
LSRSAFRSDLITIYVGPSKQKYTAHKDVLTSIDFFAGCLSSFKESETKEITLPEDRPEVFEKLLEYIYHERIRTEPVEDDSITISYIMLLLNVYADADKYCMEACQNHLMDFFFTFAQTQHTNMEMVLELSNRGLRKCKLRDFLLSEIGFSIGDLGWKFCKERDKGLSRLIREGGDDAEDLFEVSMKFVPCTDCAEAPTDAELEAVRHPKERCDWHTHVFTEKCVRAEAVVKAAE